MRRPGIASFAAFTAFFAVLAMFVFRGAWSTSVTPVMPDCPIVYPDGYFAGLAYSFRECFLNWQFDPFDLFRFVGTPYFRQELQYVLGTYCAALAIAYYARGRGLSRLAAYGAGLLLAFSGYWFTLFSAGHLGWFKWMVAIKNLSMAAFARSIQAGRLYSERFNRVM